MAKYLFTSTNGTSPNNASTLAVQHNNTVKDWKVEGEFKFEIDVKLDYPPEVVRCMCHGAVIMVQDKMRKAFKGAPADVKQWAKHVNMYLAKPFNIATLYPERTKAAKSNGAGAGKLTRAQAAELAQLMLQNGITMDELKAAAVGKPKAEIVE